MRTFALVLVVYTIFPLKKSVSLRFYKTCSLKRDIDSNIDSRLQTVIVIGIMCFSMEKPCSKRVSTLNSALQTLFRDESSSHSCFLSVCILRPIRPDTMNKPGHSNVGGNVRGSE